MKQETKTRILVALRIVGAVFKQYGNKIIAGLILLLLITLLLPWVDMLNEVQELTSDDETLTKLVDFVKLSMGVMLIPAMLGLQAMLKRK